MIYVVEPHKSWLEIKSQQFCDKAEEFQIEISIKNILKFHSDKRCMRNIILI